jgi:hypothetical protein
MEEGKFEVTVSALLPLSFHVQQSSFVASSSPTETQNADHSVPPIHHRRRVYNR